MAWLGLLAALAIASACADSEPSEEELAPRVVEERPTLALLTSLPLVFGESFGLDSGGSPALTRLEQRYVVQPIGVADAASLKGHKLLLMAHPRAQPAEALVELDQWVRGGGRVLLLADPKLDWRSERPLGDPLRPLPAFADTGLLGHWGLTLGGPRTDGPISFEVGQYLVVASSPGSLESGGSCTVSAARMIAHCSIGKGAATVIADADFLDVGGDSAADPGNLGLLIAELAKLETR